MDRVTRWERSAEWPLAIAALIFLAAYAAPIIAPDLPTSIDASCEVATWAVWGVFAADYMARLAIASDRWRFVKVNALDLAVVILPILRPLRLVRLLALVSIFQRAGSTALRGKVAIYAGGGAVLLVIVGALAVTDAERGADGANVANVGDGLWWALTTVTTVGYGDRFPVTSTGRLIAAVLMVGGVALLGVITATIASWLVERVSEVTEQQQAATRQQVDLLANEVRALRRLLESVPQGDTQAASDSAIHASRSEIGSGSEPM